MGPNNGWKAWHVGVAFALLLILGPAIQHTHWSGRHPVGDLAENVLAVLFLYGAPIVGFVAGSFAWSKVEQKTRREWLAWVVAVGVFFGAALAIYAIGWSIPSIDERMNRIDLNGED